MALESSLVKPYSAVTPVKGYEGMYKIRNPGPDLTQIVTGGTALAVAERLDYIPPTDRRGFLKIAGIAVGAGAASTACGTLKNFFGSNYSLSEQIYLFFREELLKHPGDTLTLFNEEKIVTINPGEYAENVLAKARSLIDAGIAKGLSSAESYSASVSRDLEFAVKNVLNVVYNIFGGREFNYLKPEARKRIVETGIIRPQDLGVRRSPSLGWYLRESGEKFLNVFGIYTKKNEQPPQTVLEYVAHPFIKLYQSVISNFLGGFIATGNKIANDFALGVVNLAKAGTKAAFGLTPEMRRAIDYGGNILQAGVSFGSSVYPGGAASMEVLSLVGPDKKLQFPFFNYVLTPEKGLEGRLGETGIVIPDFRAVPASVTQDGKLVTDSHGTLNTPFGRVSRALGSLGALYHVIDLVRDVFKKEPQQEQQQAETPSPVSSGGGGSTVSGTTGGSTTTPTTGGIGSGGLGIGGK